MQDTQFSYAVYLLQTLSCGPQLSPSCQAVPSLQYAAQSLLCHNASWKTTNNRQPGPPLTVPLPAQPVALNSLQSMTLLVWKTHWSSAIQLRWRCCSTGGGAAKAEQEMGEDTNMTTTTGHRVMKTGRQPRWMAGTVGVDRRFQPARHVSTRQRSGQNERLHNVLCIDGKSIFIVLIKLFLINKMGEWYGWDFPRLYSNILSDHCVTYCPQEHEH